MIAHTPQESGPVLAHDGDECSGEDKVHDGYNPEDGRDHPLDARPCEPVFTVYGCDTRTIEEPIPSKETSLKLEMSEYP